MHLLTHFSELDRNYDKYQKAIEGFKKYLKWNIVARNHIELYNSITSSTRMLTSKEPTITIAKRRYRLQQHPELFSFQLEWYG